MIFKKGFKFRLKPNCEQLGIFVQFAGAARWIFNYGLEQRTKAWKNDKRSISLYEQNNHLFYLKKEEETSWLKTIHSQVLQQSLDNLDKAFKNFFRRVKNHETPGFPRFKCKGDNESFRFPQGVKAEGNKVFLPKIGWVRFKKSREIEGVIKQTTITSVGDKWYVSFSTEIEKEVERIEPQNVLGIDVGVESFSTLFDGKRYWKQENLRFLSRELKHLRFLSRQLSKKKKGSQNRLKFKKKITSFHAKVRNQRLDFLHKFSSYLVESQDAIAIESLDIKSMLEDNHKSLSRAISDCGWRQFLTMLKYKCQEKGKWFLEAERFFPSTQECCRCHARNKIALSQRIYHCKNCNLKMHRDDNATTNVWAAGISALKACGAACISGSYEAGILRL